MRNVLKFSFHSTVVKTTFIAICCVFISSCLSTGGAKVSGEVGDLNTQLAELLSQADLTNDRTEKPALDTLATKAYTKANDLASQQQNKLALSFYQVASQAYWRDDIPTNNAAIFEIAEKVEQICAQLGDKAPDRDCFVSPLMEHLASVDMITFNPDMTMTGTNINQARAARSRALLLDLGKKSDNQVGFNNGALTNLINHAVANQAILNNHPKLNSYVCENLVAVFDKYVFALFALENYYNKENEALGARQQVNIENEHPLFKAYNQSANVQNTLSVRAKNFITMQVPSCAS